MRAAPSRRAPATHPCRPNRVTRGSTADLAPAGSEAEPVLQFGHWPAVRRCAFAIYFAVLVVWSYHYGIPVQRELVIAWVCGALAVACIGRPPREMLWLGLRVVAVVISLA